MRFAPIPLGLLLALVLLGGCAPAGPTYIEAAQAFPPLDSEKARVFFYRPSSIGFAIRPGVRLNGEKVGTAEPLGFYFVDRQPGKYEVLIITETEKTLTLVLERGDVRYVRLSPQLGIFMGRIYPELVDHAEALEQLKDLRYIARPLGD